MASGLDDDKVVIHIQGLGTFRIPHHEGWDLRMYLRDARALSHGIKKAIYDEEYLEKGRLRLNHVPGPGARIKIGSASWSPVAHLQRSSHDAMKLARNMGGGESVVEYKPQTTKTRKTYEDEAESI